MSNVPTKVTPMMRQWLDAKAKARDAILLFRMGDFYELFGEDALTAGPLVDLTVTTRDRDKGDDAMPMAGFPHHQAPQYIAKLIACGKKVAVCDQMEDPALAKGIVKRDVTRIVTPGMVLDDESLDARANNFLVAVLSDPARGFAIGAVDVSTGEVLATAFPPGDVSALLDEVIRTAPREIVLSTQLAPELATRIADRADTIHARIESRDPPSKRRLVDRLGAPDPWLSDRPHALLAVEHALAYVEETGQGKLPPHLSAPRAYALDDRLVIDPVTRGHLAVTGPSGDLRKDGTLLATIDRTKSAAGGRRLLRLLVTPFAQRVVIEQRLDRVQVLVEEPAARVATREALTGLPDIERLVARASSRRASPRDLLRLGQALRMAPVICATAREHAAAPILTALSAHTDTLTRAIAEDAPYALGGAPVFRAAFDPALDALTGLSTGGRDRIAALEETERQRTGIPSLKIRYTRVFGYTIEVTKTHAHKAPPHFIRKQTIANGERFVTEELLALESDVEGAEQKRTARELELFEQLLDEVTAHAAPLLALANVLAEIDVIACLAEVAATERWVRPAILEASGRSMRLVDARHPMVEASARVRREPYVPTSLELNADRQILVVTGPNMAGKSTMMRQAALVQLLAQAGSYVPAREAELSLCDRIFSRIGASDDLAQGRSTFMVEMTETSHILQSATKHSLVLLDEIGRGTSTYDGLSIAWAVAEHLHEVTGARTLFATHYHELVKLADDHARVKNVHVVVKEWNDGIVFVRSIAEGPSERSYGIQVARLAGLPASVLERAREVLASLENGSPSARERPQLGLFSSADVSAPPSKPAHGAREPQRIVQHVVEKSAVLERLRTMDVTQLTPLEAINALAGLIDEAKKR